MACAFAKYTGKLGCCLATSGPGGIHLLNGLYDAKLDGTLFDGADPKSVRAFFDEMMELGVEGMMLSPGYSYDKAPDQQRFLGGLVRAVISRHALQSQQEVALQSVGVVSRVFDGQARVLLHSLGHADFQCFRMAEALLPAAGRLCGYVC